MNCYERVARQAAEAYRTWRANGSIGEQWPMVLRLYIRAARLLAREAR
jgi:hypothetical protein